MSVKLYRHNESGEVVSASKILNDPMFFRLLDSHGGCGSREHVRDFTKHYTPLPEAPEVGSTAWAFDMAYRGETPFFEVGGKKCHLQNFGHTSGQPRFVLSKGKEIFMAINPEPFGTISSEITWKIYEEPKPIVECLPHELKKGVCLYRELTSQVWVKGEFVGLMAGQPRYLIGERWDYKYCLPYAGNEHLEGTVTYGEHGAVPKGYVPPHVPQLGDETYWQVGDETFCLVHGDGYVHDEDTGIDFKKPYTMCISLCGEMAHTWYDKYGKEDVQNYRTLFHRKAVKKLDNGKFEIDFNYAPTRPHKIEE